MLSEEEKQAIEYANSLIELFDSGVPLNYLEQENDNLKLFLNLIKKLKKENEKLKYKNQDLLRKLRNRVKEVKKLTKYSQYKKEFSRLNQIIKEKDKQIDLILKEQIEDGYLVNFHNLEEAREYYKRIAKEE